MVRRGPVSFYFPPGDVDHLSIILTLVSRRFFRR